MTKTMKHTITMLTALALLVGCSLTVAADNDIIQFPNDILYDNLEPGKTYTIGSSIYYAITVQGDPAEPPYTREFDSDGNPIYKAVLDANGHPYTVSTSFVASQTQGFVDNRFSINREDLEVPAKLIVFTRLVDADGRTLVRNEGLRAGVDPIGERTEIAPYVPIAIAALFMLVVLLMHWRSRLREKHATEPQICAWENPSTADAPAQVTEQAILFKRDKQMLNKAELEHIKIVSFILDYGIEGQGELAAVYNDRNVSEEEVRKFILPTAPGGYHQHIVIMTQQQAESLFGATEGG